jgi:hypothetical protein
MAEAVGPAELTTQKKRRGSAAAFFIQATGSNYFDTAFLNARSIFSLVASQQAWLA